MKTIFTIVSVLLILCMPQRINAQSKFGKITSEELEMTSYPQDTTAAAVILSRVGDTRFVYDNNGGGFKFEHTVQTKIKILKTEGLEWCNQEIGYYQQSNSAKEEIRSLSGTTYNLENGKIEKIKLSKEFIFEENTDNKLKIRKITMPSAKVGSVIEYKYTIVSDFFWDLRDFHFQSSIPVLYTYYEIVIPEYFTFNVEPTGYVPISGVPDKTNESLNFQYVDANGRRQTATERYTGNRYKYEGKDVPAFKDESYIWTVKDYISKVSFELRSIQMPYSKVRNFTSTWGAIDKDLFEYSGFGGNLKKADLFKNEITKTDINIERAREIQNIVKQKVKWDDRNALYPKDLKDALKNGIGNSADINFLLINALTAGGFDAYPVILSTRSNGRLPMTHPSIDAFNYVITGIKIDTVLYFTDASAKYGDWNILPEKCMVPKGRMLDPRYTDWIDLTGKSTGTIFKSAFLSFSDSKLKAKVVDSRRGNAALDSKANFEKYKDENEYIESLGKRLSCEIDSFSIKNMDKTNESLSMEYIQTKDASLGDEHIYINPMIDKLFDSNPFTKEERTYPIEFNYLFNYIQSVNIAIPEGYEVEELPKSEKFVLDNDASLIYRINQDGNFIRLHYQYQLRKLQFLYEDYQHLRNFYSKLILKNSEQIVLKKKSNQ